MLTKESVNTDRIDLVASAASASVTSSGTAATALLIPAKPSANATAEATDKFRNPRRLLDALNTTSTLSNNVIPTSTFSAPLKIRNARCALATVLSASATASLSYNTTCPSSAGSFTPNASPSAFTCSSVDNDESISGISRDFGSNFSSCSPCNTVVTTGTRFSMTVPSETPRAPIDKSSFSKRFRN